MGEGLLRSLEWERESYPGYRDFAALPVFAIFFPTLRFFLDRIVFEVSEDWRIRFMFLCLDQVSEFGQLFLLLV